MTKKKIIAPNIIRGGAAIPLGDNIYLLKGKKHSQGGIDIGKDLEAEGDEVVKMNPKSIKVVTAQKIMGGKSPAELVVNASSTGEQDKVFNDVFKYQEEFKDRNNLNDDGTKKAKFGKEVKDFNSKMLYNPKQKKEIKIQPPLEIGKKHLKQRDYIGGTPEEARLKAFNMMPKVKSYIEELSKTYGIDKNVLTHRFLREGWVDDAIKGYNTKTLLSQKNYFDKIANRWVDGYWHMGLDDAGTHLSEGKYKLRREVPYYTTDATNEKNRPVTSISTDNLYDALEIKAADMEYRQNELRKRGISDEDINAYVNAAYNMGLYHKDLNNAEYIKNNYSVPNYYKLGGMKQFKNRRKFFTGGETETVIPTNKRTEGKDFLNKWYSNPTTKKIIEEVAGTKNTNIHEQINKAINSTPEYIAADINNKVKLPKEIIKDTSIYNTKHRGEEYNPNESDNSIISKFNAGDTQAFFNKGKGYILYKRGGNQPGVQASMLDRAVQEQVHEILNTTKPVEDKLRKGVKYNNKLDNKNAVRSRIMELRYKTNLSPEKRDYTPKDVEELLKHENIKNTELENNLKRLDTQTLSDYLNYMADSNTKTNTDNLAKLGTNKQFKGRHKAALGTLAAGQLISSIAGGLTDLGSVIGANVYTKKQLDKAKQSTLDYNQSVYDSQNTYNTEKYNKYNELLDKYHSEDLANLEKHKITRKDAVYNPVKLKTKININPRLQAIQRQQDENIESIVQNTSSSKDMLNRIRKERLNARDKEVELQGQKEYAESQLINQDLLQRKATMEKQVDANLRIDELRARDQENYYNNLAALNRGYNQNKLSSEIDYLQNKYNTENLKRNSDYEAENAYRQGRMENRMNLIQGISDSIGKLTSGLTGALSTQSTMNFMNDAYGNNNVKSTAQTQIPVGMQNPTSQYFGNSAQNSYTENTYANTQQGQDLLNSIIANGFSLKRFGGKTKIKRRNK